MGRDRWLWVGCCAALACTPLQEGAGDENDGGSSTASETSMNPVPTSSTTTGSSADGSSGSTDAPPPQTTGGLDDTGSTSDTPDTGSTTAPETTVGSSDDTGVPMNLHDGEYTGALSIAFTVFGVGVYPCDGTVTFTVIEAGAPQITGAGSCAVAIPEWGGAFVDVTVTVDGTLAGAAGSGNLNLGIAALGVADTSSWSGTFSGDTFDGSFSDSTQVLGFATTYDGTWTTTR